MALTYGELKYAADRARDKLARGGDAPEERAPDTIQNHFIKITSTTQTAGRYPATRYEYDANADSFTAMETCWLKAVNGDTLATGTYYEARLVGTKTSDGLSIYSQTTTAPAAATESPLPGVIAQTGPQSISDSTTTDLLWGAETRDTNNFHSTSSNTERFAPTPAGLYLAVGTFFWPVNGTGYRMVTIVPTAGDMAGGVATVPGIAGVPSFQYMEVSALIDWAATSGEYIKVSVRQNSGLALNCFGNFSLTRIGRAS